MVDVPHELELTDPQTRVLGCLIEKQMTTPDAYPLTLKALTTACNQTSNRDPVVDYEATLVETTIQALKAKGLARIVHPASGERATKYRQVIDEALGLDGAAKALLSVLFLRGAQTVNELRTRTERLHGFASTEEIDAVLEQMTDQGSPTGRRELVRRIEPGPGRKEARWIQLLQVGVDERAEVAAASSAGGSVGGGSRQAGRVEELEQRVVALEAQVASLHEALGIEVTVSSPAGSSPA